ncbi:hypothetical protein SJ05684_c31520 [Sinorhizobium sojae CCBAU 05684]|uniref:Uncharacterized protein n=1 Tax=Sinorhizobium sojae CCBAU 05684 TaxID=716928 RepID=A0A249PFJ0_9HYPH|nr:mitofilin family membrane protein [Sinorhizobium sojae]ASY64576.1 hypothetical protein SJ05684_c31520 [Sinorhizobium sojae CCBAU 05684]
MVSEKPPRRSKPEKEPLTIDLEAERTETEAEAVADRDPVTDKPADMAASQTPGPGEAEHPETEYREAQNQETENQETESQEAERQEEAEAERVDSAAAAFDEEPPHLNNAAAPETKARRPSASGALAAGILGGLVALAGAGVLQYAGYLPTLGPERGNGAAEQELRSEIEAVKAELQARPRPASVDIAPLESRVAALEQTTGAPAGAPDVTALQAEIGNLTEEIAALKAGLADVRQTTNAERSELAARIDEAEQKLNAPANDIRMAKAVAVTALKTAIDRGGPFLAELDQLRSVAPEDETVKELADHAPTGVATRVQLRTEFPAAASAMLDALIQPDPDEGIFDRLVSSAMSGIRVRPVGSIEGDSPEAVIARIEDKLDNGDLKGASLEWANLPEPAKSAGQEFKEKLDRRLHVETIIDAAMAEAMARSGTQG